MNWRDNAIRNILLCGVAFDVGEKSCVGSPLVNDLLDKVVKVTINR